MTIQDFAKKYADSGVTRLHMPGHKGTTIHGLEPLDITEISGADFLFEPDGVIRESERRTSAVFGSRYTCYSAEGSSLSIKSALAVLRQYFGRPVTVASPRNCHRAFISGCALLGIDPVWIYPDSPSALLCQCAVSPAAVEKCIGESRPDAVYLTSPDYLGSIADVAQIAEICHKNGVYLICDNAHGAYLKFTDKPAHPLDLGADIVCDSAHKTLPVYTSGAYLHISKNAPDEFVSLAKPAMAMLGSTSPSYLIMESLDICANLLEGELPAQIRKCCMRVDGIKELMAVHGMENLSAEPMKITVAAERFGYSGTELADVMRGFKTECEYADPAAVVLMFSPYNTEEDYRRVEEFIKSTPARAPIEADSRSLNLPAAEKAMSIREAMLSAAKRVPVESAEGKICARSAMSCQPSVAVVMAGEKISAEIIKILKRYSIFEIDVL